MLTGTSSSVIFVCVSRRYSVTYIYYIRILKNTTENNKNVHDRFCSSIETRPFRLFSNWPNLSKRAVVVDIFFHFSVAPTITVSYHIVFVFVVRARRLIHFYVLNRLRFTTVDYDDRAREFYVNVF